MQQHDGTGDSHSEWSKSERKRQIPYNITYIWNLINSKNEAFHRKENHGHGEETCGCQGGMGGSGMEWELGVNRCRLLPLEWISNEILLCRGGNLWCLVTYDGAWYCVKIECVHVYVTGSPGCTVEKIVLGK